MHNRNIFYTLTVVLIFVLFYNFFLSAPNNFPHPVTIKVEKGSTLRSVSSFLHKEKLIRSRVVFEALVITFGKENVVEAEYYFEIPVSVFEVADRISKGRHNQKGILVTIPEGFDNREIAEVFASKLVNFDKQAFLLKAEGFQGYLFPDTYLFLRTADHEVVFLSMRENFKKKIKTVESDILSSRKTEGDVIKMASVIEGEAKGEGDRAMISGILWKRIKIGMSLQADAAPETYKSKGLPKIPINNPGMASVVAAIHPTSTEYLYYLHDKEGVIHYAKTYAIHLKNIQKYLR